MKANEEYSKTVEFVKKHGMPLAEMIINDSPSWAKSYFLGIEEYEGSDFSQSYEDCLSLNYLKRIVESHELVESYGGLEKAKLRCYPAKHLTMESYHKLKQAISDVEL